MRSLTGAVAAVVVDDTGRVLLCRQGRRTARWALPGGRSRPGESPDQAVVRDVHAETGLTVEVVDLVGIYHLPAAPDAPPAGRAGPPPDVLVHVLRARVRGSSPAGVPGGGCRLSWHDPCRLPEPLTPVTRWAVADATAGRSGVLREVRAHAGTGPPTAHPGLPAARPGKSADRPRDTADRPRSPASPAGRNGPDAR
ncbi:NUDIX domain-containing protein [Micromonospora sp. NPDC023956]|uniref:NUDIX hydrolase n=1 Tax=Micromonospora sp. NPDC023956 TaxID=3155722 RepID=UPI00340C8859